MVEVLGFLLLVLVCIVVACQGQDHRHRLPDLQANHYTKPEALISGHRRP